MRSIEPDAAPDAPLTFIASTDGIKRDGLRIPVTAWDLTNYRKNPIVLWGHDYMGLGPAPLPIGRAEVGQSNDALVSQITFDPDDEFARRVEAKYRAGYLHAVSVGWNALEMGADTGGRVVERADLLDISAVNVPGDPDALALRMARALAGAGLIDIRTIIETNATVDSLFAPEIAARIAETLTLPKTTTLTDDVLAEIRSAHVTLGSLLAAAETHEPSGDTPPLVDVSPLQAVRDQLSTLVAKEN